MRTTGTEVVWGRISGTAIPYQGPLTAQKVSNGKYWVFPPPGRKIVGISAIPYAPAQWLMVKCDDISGDKAQITFANTAATETDNAFVYIAVLEA